MFVISFLEGCSYSVFHQENLQGSMDPCLPKGPPETEQCIVPQLLIDHYVSMVDPSRAQTVDNDIARQYINSFIHCFDVIN